MVEKASDVIPDNAELHDIDKVSRIVDSKDLETLIVASIQTLKRNNKNMVVTEEVFRLLEESAESEVTKKILEEPLDALVESHSLKIKLVRTRTCLLLTKLGQCSNSNESSNESLAINANEELKNSILESFDALKLSFFAEVNSYANEVFINNSERLIRQSQDNINSLREQLKNKDKIINSLQKQLSKRDNRVVLCNHSSTRETL